MAWSIEGTMSVLIVRSMLYFAIRKSENRIIVTGAIRTTLPAIRTNTNGTIHALVHDNVNMRTIGTYVKIARYPNLAI